MKGYFTINFTATSVQKDFSILSQQAYIYVTKSRTISLLSSFESFLALHTSPAEKSFKTAIIEGRHTSGILKPFEPGFVQANAEAEDAIDDPSSDPLTEGAAEGDNIGGGVRGGYRVR